MRREGRAWNEADGYDTERDGDRTDRVLIHFSCACTDAEHFLSHTRTENERKRRENGTSGETQLSHIG